MRLAFVLCLLTSLSFANGAGRFNFVPALVADCCYIHT